MRKVASGQWLVASGLILILTMGCTHWLIDTENRIQVENQTGKEIYDLSLVSDNGKIKVLVPDTLKGGEFSQIYKSAWVGKFDFAVFSEDSRVDLGFHELKGGLVLVQIRERGEKFEMRFR